MAPELEASALAVDRPLHRRERVGPEPAERHDLVAPRHDVDRVKLDRAQVVQLVDRIAPAIVAEALGPQGKCACLLEREAWSHVGYDTTAELVWDAILTIPESAAD